ncbi:MAG: hypothetical protein ACE5Q6_25070 [Dehalococcoidia bacterium]
MDSLLGTEKDQPEFDEDEVAMILEVAQRFNQLVEVDLEAPVINRQAVLKFCKVAGEMVGRLRDLASGNPERLREYLQAH